MEFSPSCTKNGATNATIASPRMTVNVSLCGAIPRSAFSSSGGGCGLQPPPSFRANSGEVTLGSLRDANVRNGSPSKQVLGDENSRRKDSDRAPQLHEREQRVSGAKSEANGDDDNDQRSAQVRDVLFQATSSRCGTIVRSTVPSSSSRGGEATESQGTAAAIASTVITTTTTTTSSRSMLRISAPNQPPQSQDDPPSSSSAKSSSGSGSGGYFQLHPRPNGPSCSPNLRLDLGCLRSVGNGSAPPPLHRPSSEDTADCGAAESMPLSGANPAAAAAVRPTVEPPTWAVPAMGEARLEPVGLATPHHLYPPRPLHTQPCYAVGRAPQSTIQLYHATSSRRHALLFHHPNGNCYVVDCGSVYGTWVDGRRVPSPQQGNHSGGVNANPNSTTPMVVPHRVRRGALLRFGGPDAPTFVLKSFGTEFESLVDRLEATAISSVGEEPEIEEGVGSDGMHVDQQRGTTALTSSPPPPPPTSSLQPPPSLLPILLAQRLREVSSAGRRASGGRNSSSPTSRTMKENNSVVLSDNDCDGTDKTKARVAPPYLAPNPPRETSGSSSNLNDSTNEKESLAALTRLNTRLNAITDASPMVPAGRKLARRAVGRLFGDALSRVTVLGGSKRSAAAGAATDACTAASPTKRARNDCGSPPLADEAPSSRSGSVNAALISPVTSRPVFASPVPPTRITDGVQQLPPPPLVQGSSMGMGIEHSELFQLVETPILSVSQGTTTGSGSMASLPAALCAPPLLSSSKMLSGDAPTKGGSGKQVKFATSRNLTQVYFAHPVTPEEMSGDDDYSDDGHGSSSLPLCPTTPRESAVSAVAGGSI